MKTKVISLPYTDVNGILGNTHDKQHLYLVFDDDVKQFPIGEIKKGDYFINKDSLWINNGINPESSAVKVIATTNSKLFNLPLPLIPQSLITDYVNSQGKIDSVEIETHSIYDYIGEDIEAVGDDIKLTITNEVIISNSKEVKPS